MNFLEQFKRIGVELSNRETRAMAGHLELLENWNESAFLVSRGTLAEPFSVHYADSYYISDFCNRVWPSGDVHDLGSGAGFPGIIFAIRYPQRQIHLYEKRALKRAFLENAKNELALENVIVESSLNSKVSGLVMSRAVLPPNDLVDFLDGHVIEGVGIICTGGSGEPPVLKNPRITPLSRTSYELPDGKGSRRVTAIKIVPRGT